MSNLRKSFELQEGGEKFLSRADENLLFTDRLTSSTDQAGRKSVLVDKYFAINCMPIAQRKRDTLCQSSDSSEKIFFSALDQATPEERVGLLGGDIPKLEKRKMALLSTIKGIEVEIPESAVNAQPAIIPEVEPPEVIVEEEVKDIVSPVAIEPPPYDRTAKRLATLIKGLKDGPGKKFLRSFAEGDIKSACGLQLHSDQPDSKLDPYQIMRLGFINKVYSRRLEKVFPDATVVFFAYEYLLKHDSVKVIPVFEMARKEIDETYKLGDIREICYRRFEIAVESVATDIADSEGLIQEMSNVYFRFPEFWKTLLGTVMSLIGAVVCKITKLVVPFPAEVKYDSETAEICAIHCRGKTRSIPMPKVQALDPIPDESTIMKQMDSTVSRYRRDLDTALIIVPEEAEGEGESSGSDIPMLSNPTHLSKVPTSKPKDSAQKLKEAMPSQDEGEGESGTEVNEPSKKTAQSIFAGGHSTADLLQQLVKKGLDAAAADKESEAAGTVSIAKTVKELKKEAADKRLQEIAEIEAKRAKLIKTTKKEQKTHPADRTQVESTSVTVSTDIEKETKLTEMKPIPTETASKAEDTSRIPPKEKETMATASAPGLPVHDMRAQLTSFGFTPEEVDEVEASKDNINTRLSLAALGGFSALQASIQNLAELTEKSIKAKGNGSRKRKSDPKDLQEEKKTSVLGPTRFASVAALGDSSRSGGRGRKTIVREKQTFVLENVDFSAVAAMEGIDDVIKQITTRIVRCSSLPIVVKRQVNAINELLKGTPLAELPTAYNWERELCTGMGKQAAHDQIDFIVKKIHGLEAVEVGDDGDDELD